MRPKIIHTIRKSKEHRQPVQKKSNKEILQWTNLNSGAVTEENMPPEFLWKRSDEGDTICRLPDDSSNRWRNWV